MISEKQPQLSGENCVWFFRMGPLAPGFWFGKNQTKKLCNYWGCYCSWLGIIHDKSRSLLCERDQILELFIPDWREKSRCDCLWLGLVHDKSRSLLFKRDRKLYNCSYLTFANWSGCFCYWHGIVCDNSRSLFVQKNREVLELFIPDSRELFRFLLFMVWNCS